MKSRERLVGALIVVLLTLGFLKLRMSASTTLHAIPAVNAASSADRGKPPEKVTSYRKLPMSFEANQGQTDERVKFLSRGQGYNLFLTPDEALLSLFQPQTEGADDAATGGVPLHAIPQTMVRMKLRGANAFATAAGVDEIATRSNYYIGNDPKRWRTGIANYSRVRFSEVYPGVDMVYYGNPRELEYDFDVAPGGDPRAIRLKFAGARNMAINSTGDLTMFTPAGELVIKRPAIYQLETDTASVNGTPAKRRVEGGYRLTGRHEVSFQVAAYDRSKPLIIDPVSLVYSNFLGGALADSGNAIAVDSSGNAYVTGSTASVNFPNPGCTFGCAYFGGPMDAFVTEFNPAGFPVFSDFLGGAGNDRGFGIAVDGFGFVYVTGATSSANFLTIGCTQCVFGGGGMDAFVTILNPGGAPFSSTFLGGTGMDFGLSIAVDANRGPYVTGYTSSANFPVTGGVVQPAFGGGAADAFVTRYVPAAPGYVYSTYLGGNGADYGRGIALDPQNDACVTGNTLSINFPTHVPFQPAKSGLSDAFVSCVLPNGAAFLYSTYLGGPGNDYGRAIAVDSSAQVYVTGDTFSAGFPVTPGVFQPAKAGPPNTSDAFVTKYKIGGGGYTYSTFLGGVTNDSGNGIALDISKNAYIVGTTAGSFPAVPCTFGCAYGGGVSDAFVTSLNPPGTALIYSDYLGGAGKDAGLGAAVNTSFGLFATGNTASANFPITVCAFCVYNGGTMDAFVSRVQ